MSNTNSEKEKTSFSRKRKRLANDDEAAPSKKTYKHEGYPGVFAKPFKANMAMGSKSETVSPIPINSLEQSAAAEFEEKKALEQSAAAEFEEKKVSEIDENAKSCKNNPNKNAFGSNYFVISDFFTQFPFKHAKSLSLLDYDSTDKIAENVYFKIRLIGDELMKKGIGSSKRLIFVGQSLNWAILVDLSYVCRDIWTAHFYDLVPSGNSEEVLMMIKKLPFAEDVKFKLCRWNVSYDPTPKVKMQAMLCNSLLVS
nr:PREDICTED: uncharacterized protein LOC109043500 [Bemisia tabaci]